MKILEGTTLFEGAAPSYDDCKVACEQEATCIGFQYNFDDTSCDRYEKITKTTSCYVGCTGTGRLTYCDTGMNFLFIPLFWLKCYTSKIIIMYLG